MPNHHSAPELFEFCAENWPETHNTAHQFGLYLRRLSELNSAENIRIFKKHGLSAAEFDVLSTLRRAKAPHILSPSELQCSTLLSSGGQTKLLYQLQDRGLISRSLNPEDKRGKFVHLTEAGKLLIEASMSEMLQRQGNFLSNSGLKKKERKQLLDLLGRLLASLEAPRDSATDHQGIAEPAQGLNKELTT